MMTAPAQLSSRPGEQLTAYMILKKANALSSAGLDAEPKFGVTFGSDWIAADQCTQTRVDSAGIPQLPDPRQVFVTGDEIMGFFSGEKMRDMGFDDPAFLRASQ
jgi:hypothetical protein